jgi:hypothetical protein
MMRIQLLCLGGGRTRAIFTRLAGLVDAIILGAIWRCHCRGHSLSTSSSRGNSFKQEKEEEKEKEREEHGGTTQSIFLTTWNMVRRIGTPAFPPVR